MIITESWVRRKLRNLLVRLYTHIENEGNADFSTNGERVFLDALALHLSSNTDQEATMHIFDIGANQGAYSELIRAQIGIAAQIHLFEPVEALCEQIKIRFHSDHLIHINQTGVASVDGNRVLYSDCEASTHGSFIQRYSEADGLKLAQRIQVPTTRLDTYIDRVGIKHINFIKIDTEGYEFEVVQSLGRYLDPSFIDFVQFEYGGTSFDAGISLRKLFEYFEAAGYVVAKIMRTGLMIRPYGAWMDDFRYANFVAISHQILPSLRGN